MKNYKRFMNIVVKIENVVLALSMLLVLALTFGNVVARKIFQHSWGFTEEIVVAVFVLISLLGAGVAARDGGLVNLGLIPDHVSLKAKKVLNTISMAVVAVYAVVLTAEGWSRMMTDHTLSPILHISKSIFWTFVVIGGISLLLHCIEYGIDMAADKREEERQ
ncbi:MAG: TRAP transporter small permease [Lachnospiraceae bacterium]|nr:TRAP transporter small permease [Lachnospiraceae bacterium]